MIDLFKDEIHYLSAELKKLDSKSILILLSSTILLVVSWYFANPKFFNESVYFIHEGDILFEELISFIFWFLFDFVLFFLIPIYIIKLILKEDLKSFGLAAGDVKIGLFYLIISLIILIPIIYLTTHSENFKSYFPLMQNAKDDLYIFLLYEIFLIIFIFSWEFIFRGFLLFGLEKKFGFYAVFIQMIPFALLHTGKPFVETFASIFGGLFLGYLALRARSILYGFLIHTIILVTLDIISTM